MDVVLVCIVALGLIGFVLSTLLRLSFVRGAFVRDAVLADD